MTSARQRAANRRNAQKSTGPRTDAGKAVSAQNARKHGIFGADIAHGGEDPAAFDALVEALRGDLKPVGPLEEGLVDQLAVAFWRNKRLVQAERDRLNHKPEESYSTRRMVETDSPFGQFGAGLGFEYQTEEVVAEVGAAPIAVRLLFGRYQVMITNEIKRTLDMFYAAQERRLNALEAVAQDRED